MLHLLPSRYAEKIRPEGECWVWNAYCMKNGYGLTSKNRRTVLAHRLIYEILVGPIQEGLELDHLCRVRACVNPAHLEIVTKGENLLRGNGFAGINHRKH